MALIDEVQLRIPVSAIVKLTNPNDRTASIPNLATLQLACDDVEADFQSESGLTFDLTDRKHLSMVIEGVRIKLRSWINTGLSNVDTAYEKWLLRANKIEDKTRKAAFSAKTTSNLSPQRETGQTRPVDDLSHFNDIRSRPPGSAFSGDNRLTD